MGEPGRDCMTRFGVFELDRRSGELRKAGTRIRLQDQPLKVLTALLERPGEVVTREELQRLIWPKESFGDFDHALSVAVGKLRTALNDSPDVPRFIETLPRRGYRFIGAFVCSPAVGEVPRGSEEIESVTPTTVQPHGRADNQVKWLKIGAGILFAATCVVALVSSYLRWRPRAEQSTLTPIPLTAFPGEEVAPTFSPDGAQVAFAWTGDPASGPKGFDLYVKVIGSENLLQLTHHPSDWISPAWSPDGTQIAFHRISGADTGLYVIPALGGAERKLRSTHITHITDRIAASIGWSPDGKWIAYADILPDSEGLRLNLLSFETLKSNEIPHLANCLFEGLPAFTHDGKQLAYFCLSRFAEENIYSVAIEGGSSKLIATSTGLPSGGAWTRD